MTAPRSWLALLLLAASAWAQPGPTRPNVLVLTVDGLGPTSAPTLEFLARRARVFERAYLPHPLSGPSRAALYFGRPPTATGVWEEAEARPDGVVLLHERFARAGYLTARVGRAVSEAVDAQVPWDWTSPPSPDADTSQRVIAFLKAPRDKPLFLAASFDDLGPAVGVTGDAGGTAAAAERPAIALDDLPFLGRPSLRHAPTRVTDEAREAARRAREERERRLGEQLTRIHGLLQRRGLWENTIVALVGTEAPAPIEQGALPRPDVLFEESLRVPLVVAVPGLERPNDATTALADVTDLYPTLVELAGLPPVESQARSLAGLVRDPQKAGPSAVASVVRRSAGRVGRSVRTPRWRFNEWPDGSEELYDHQADPLEQTNLARRSDLASTRAEMKALLTAHEQELATGAATPPAPRAAKPSRRRPNVLVIVFDDLNVRVGTYGYPVKTPNIDRLAQRGRRFEYAYAQVAQCSPSRTSLLSGWYPGRTAVWHNVESPRSPGMVPLQEHFGANGYFTARLGKVWETAFAKDFRWDVSQHDLDEGGGGGRDDDARAAPPVSDHGQGHHWWLPTENRDEDEPDGRRARRVAQVMAEKRDRPFFIALGVAKPHLRWVAPRRYFDLYDPAQIEVPKGLPDLTLVPAIAIKNREQPRPGLSLAGREPPGLQSDPELRRRATAAYYAAISFADAQVGVVLDALDRLQLWDDTIVVLLSDHGYHLGEHGGLWRKDTLFEESLRVPLIVAAPGMKQAGLPTASPVELLDVYPTLVDLAGLPQVPGLDGKSLVPQLDDPAASVHRAAFSWRPVQPPTVAASLRRGPWRYTEWPDGSEELFDVEKDPAQSENLISRPDLAAVLGELRALRAEMVP